MWTMNSFNRKAPWESTPFPWNTTPSFPSHHDRTKDYRSKESSLSGWRSCIMMKKEWLLAQRLSLPFFDVASVTFGPPVLFSLAFSKHKWMLFMILGLLECVSDVLLHCSPTILCLQPQFIKLSILHEQFHHGTKFPIMEPSCLASTTSKLRCFQSHCCRIRSCCWEARKESPGERPCKGLSRVERWSSHPTTGRRGGGLLVPEMGVVGLSVHEQNQINYSSCVAVLWETQNTFLWGKDLQFTQDLIVAGTVLCCVLPCDSSSVAHCFRAFMLIPASWHKRYGRWFWWLNAMVFEELWIHVHGKNLSGSDQH